MVQTMNPALQSLLVLQERDLKIFESKHDLEQIPLEAAKIKEGLTKKLQSLEQAKASYMQAEKEVKQVDLDRQVRKETITKLKMRQGETKKNEEYQMLAHEIIRYGEEIDALETKELELMEQVDLRIKEREVAKEALAQEKVFATEISQNLVARKKNSEKRIDEAVAERDELSSKVDPESLAIYQRILDRRGGKAVVLITAGGKCTGCNMKLPPSTLHQVLADTELVQCSECSRILYNA